MLEADALRRFRFNAGVVIFARLALVFGKAGAGYLAAFGVLHVARLAAVSGEDFGIRRNRRIYREHLYYDPASPRSHSIDSLD